MAEKAKNESARLQSKISYAKRWVIRSLNSFEIVLLARSDKLDPHEFKKHNDQFQDQCDKIVALQTAIGEIYIKHKAQSTNTI